MCGIASTDREWSREVVPFGDNPEEGVAADIGMAWIYFMMAWRWQGFASVDIVVAGIYARIHTPYPIDTPILAG